MGDYNIYLGFPLKQDFLFPFYIYNFFNFHPYIKMYCLMCRRVTETENITAAASTNGNLMRCGRCNTRGKTKTQFIKKGAAGGSFLNTL